LISLYPFTSVHCNQPGLDVTTADGKPWTATTAATSDGVASYECGHGGDDDLCGMAQAAVAVADAGGGGGDLDVIRITCFVCMLP
jgi:hypothetical protein